jgi:glycosyltransferase involved in cell wall biosynthesis
MSDGKPIASVLIFAYNHAQYIEETILSVVTQKCSFEFEVIITDDCSTDNTLQIITNTQKSFPGLIEIINNEHNLGLNSAFFNAVHRAKGEFIALLGGDDKWIFEKKLELQIMLLVSNKRIAYVHTDFHALKEINNTILSNMCRNWASKLQNIRGGKALIAMLCHEWTGYPCSSTSCFRKKALLQGLAEHLQILEYDLSGEGTIIHTSMCYYGGLYAFLPIPTTMYRIRERSLSHQESPVAKFEYQRKYFELRLFAAKEYGLSVKERKKIDRKGYFILFKEALYHGTLIEFRRFRAERTHESRPYPMYSLLILLAGNKLARYVLIKTMALMEKSKSIMLKAMFRTVLKT